MVRRFFGGDISEWRQRLRHAQIQTRSAGKALRTWVPKNVDAKVGEVTINLSFAEGRLKLVAWSELFFAGKVKEMKGPYKVRGDTISSKAIRGGTKAKFWFDGEQLVLEFEDGKIVRFHRESETR